MSYASTEVEMLAHLLAEDRTKDLEAKLRATQAVLADREAELLELKGPCRVAGCRSHRAHRGPCDIAQAVTS